MTRMSLNVGVPLTIGNITFFKKKKKRSKFQTKKTQTNKQKKGAQQQLNGTVFVIQLQILALFKAIAQALQIVHTVAIAHQHICNKKVNNLFLDFLFFFFFCC